MSKILLMTMRRAALTKSNLIVRAVFIFLIVGSAFPAWAALGADFASVQADQVHLQGTLRSTAMGSYTVHEIQAASGTVVREYVSSSGVSAGKVFAIGWKGPWPPDMRQVLGSYFDQYVEGVKAQRAARVGRAPLVIEQPGLVVHMSGHPRSFSGQAYVPEMLPAGVHAEDIQ
ncbi:MAG: DUF2844 domain-containing protein [Candidatus Sulfotelmatobacter sp.]